MAAAAGYQVGDKIVVKPSKKGQIIVVVDGGKGNAKHFALGTWYGVRLTEKKGTCDGRYKNKDPYFFQCPMGFGTFVQSKLIIKKIDDESFNYMAEEKEIETQKKKESAKYDKEKSKISALKTAFKKLDSDSSAKLEQNEFVRLAVEQLGCDNDSAVKLFKKIDVSGNETVSFAEFDSWLKSGGEASVNKLLTFVEEDEKKDMDESEVKIVSMELYLVTIPLSHPYICGDLTFENQSNVVCKIETNAGIFGFGESNPDEGFTEETPESIWKVTESEIFPLIHDKNALDIENISGILDANIDHSNVMATGMINMALWDIYGKYYKKPVYQCLVDLSDNKEKEVFNEKIPLLYPVSDQSIDKDTQVLQEKMNEGYKTFMLKMGANQDISYQIERIKNIEKVFGPIGTNVFIVTDANEGYSFEQSMEFIKGCAGIKLSFIEQPIKKTEHENLKKLCQECLKYGFDLSLDESVQDINAINYCIKHKLGSVFSVKVSKNGGISKLYEIVNLLKKNGIKCCFNSMLEFGICQSALLSVIAVTENIVNMGHCFMSTLRFKDDITDFKTLISKDKVVSLSQKYGLGITINQEKLATYSSKTQILRK